MELATTSSTTSRVAESLARAGATGPAQASGSPDLGRTGRGPARCLYGTKGRNSSTSWMFGRSQIEMTSCRSRAETTVWRNPSSEPQVSPVDAIASRPKAARAPAPLKRPADLRDRQLTEGVAELRRDDRSKRSVSGLGRCARQAARPPAVVTDEDRPQARASSSSRDLEIACPAVPGFDGRAQVPEDPHIHRVSTSTPACSR